MSGKYILAHDLGTSGNKATLYNFDGKLVASCLYEYSTFYPDDRFVEQDPNDWWVAVCNSTNDLIEKSGIKAADVATVSFSGQMMGCLLVDDKGESIRNSIIWADTRSAVQEKKIIEKIGMEKGYHITGHRLSASYSAAKLMWIVDNEPEVYKKAYKMLNAKDYIIAKLTGSFVTDYSDASGTNLFDINTKKWSEEIVEELGIRKDLLPEIHRSAEVVGKVTAKAARECHLLEGTPVVTGGGDGSCACVGAGVVSEGKTYNVLGSSSWISMATTKPVFDEKFRTFNWVHLDENLYTPCGTMQAAGMSFSWFRNMFCEEERKTAKEQNVSAYDIICEGIKGTEPGANGLIYLPYLLGERSPRWNHEATGAFVGFRVTSTKYHMARSVLEGVGYNLKVILDILDTNKSISEIILIGGGAKGEVWAQILADIWQKPLLIPAYLEEATSMGAAVCGGIGIGAFEDYSIMDKCNAVKKVIQPNKENAKIYEKLYKVFDSYYDNICSTYSMLAGIK